MLSSYPACFFKEDIGYSVIFPDLNYLATCGETFDEAYAMAVDCLAGYLHWLQEDNEIAPAPSLIENIIPSDVAKELDTECSEAFVNMVTVDVAEYAKTYFDESVKKILAIPIWLNTIAIEQNIDFSQVLQEALKEKLHIG